MEVNPSFPAKTVPEFLAYAKANTAKVNMASTANGTVNCLNWMTGINMIHVRRGLTVYEVEH